MSGLKLPDADRRVLRESVRVLERESLISQLAALTGEPVTLLLARMPKAVTREIQKVIHRALQAGLNALVKWTGYGAFDPGPAGYRVLSGVTGGVGGFFGLASLAVELPVTTMLMLRAIAAIARKEGEDLSKAEVRLACLEVFALGPGGKDGSEAGAETSYFASRAFLSKSLGEASQVLVERGLTGEASPAALDLITAIGSRFGLAVSEKAAAEAIPVVGAIGGAAVNVAFMHHFQRLAQAHFAIRRLERTYGSLTIQRAYEACTRAMDARAEGSPDL